MSETPHTETAEKDNLLEKVIILGILSIGYYVLSEIFSISMKPNTSSPHPRAKRDTKIRVGLSTPESLVYTRAQIKADLTLYRQPRPVPGNEFDR